MTTFSGLPAPRAQPPAAAGPRAPRPVQPPAAPTHRGRPWRAAPLALLPTLLLLSGCGGGAKSAAADAATDAPADAAQTAPAPTLQTTTSTKLESTDGGPSVMTTRIETVRVTVGTTASGDSITTTVPVEALSTNAPANAPRVPLQLRPTTEFYYTEFYYVISTGQALGGPAGQPLRSERTLTFSFEKPGPAAADGALTLTGTIGRVTAQASGAGRTQDLDSARPDAITNPLGPLRGQLDQPFTVVLDATGQPGTPTGLPAPAPGGQGLVARLLAPAELRQALALALDIYPPRQAPGVAVGDVWEQSRLLTVNGATLNLHPEYTLTGIADGVAHVRVGGRVFGIGNTTATGTIVGTYDYDLATGLLRRGELTQTCNIEAAPVPAGAPAATYQLVLTTRVEGIIGGIP